MMKKAKMGMGFTMEGPRAVPTKVAKVTPAPRAETQQRTARNVGSMFRTLATAKPGCSACGGTR